MTKKTYSEKLQDVRWQQKRLSVLNRDNWACVSCGSKTTLHVHHFYYTKGADPWDYPDEHLASLCPSCHELVQKCQEDLMGRVAERGVGFLMYLSNNIPWEKAAYRRFLKDERELTKYLESCQK